MYIMQLLIPEERHQLDSIIRFFQDISIFFVAIQKNES